MIYNMFLPEKLVKPTENPPTPVDHTYYGVRYNGNTQTWQRLGNAVNFSDPIPAVNGGTGSSPFDNILPWSGMVRITNSEAGEVVAIPKFYYNLTISNNIFTLNISNTQLSGYKCSPAHMDRGDGKGERDVIYVGRYLSAHSTYKSVTQSEPAKVADSVSRVGCHNLGNTVWSIDYATLITIQMLYLVEFANWDSQAAIGYGCGVNSDTDISVLKTGSTDAMQYHTGTMQTSRTTYGIGIQYRYIEDLWAYYYCSISGLFIDDSYNIWSTLIPQGEATAFSPDYIEVGNVATAFSGFPHSLVQSTVSNFDWIFLPNSVGDTASFFADYQEYVHGSNWVSGGQDNTQNAGLFCIKSLESIGDTYYAGCRVIILP